MDDVPDHDLIGAYARAGSEAAFGELVRRHIDLVYSTAHRVLRNPSLAEEITQRTFVALAQNAQKLRHRTVLTGWLHETTRNFAITMVRSEECRRAREQKAATMEPPDSNNTEAAWDRMAPHLDEALGQLSQADRDIILLRYFERKTAHEMGVRLGLSDEAAQKRAVRALDRLRTILSERGLAASAAGLVALLSIHAVQGAPLGLTASVISAAAGSKTAISATSTVGYTMTKLTIGLAAGLIATVGLISAIHHHMRLLHHPRRTEPLWGQTDLASRSGLIPLWSLHDLDGNTVSSDDFSGRVVFLNFWATWCPPCRQEIPDLVRFTREHGTNQAVIVGVAVGEPDETVRAFAKTLEINYPILKSDPELQRLLGDVGSLPTTIVIDGNGKVVGRHSGSITLAGLDRWTKQLRATTASTR